MIRQRILALFLVFVFVFSTSACSGKQTDSSSPASAGVDSGLASEDEYLDSGSDLSDNETISGDNVVSGADVSGSESRTGASATGTSSTGTASKGSSNTPSKASSQPTTAGLPNVPVYQYGGSGLTSGQKIDYSKVTVPKYNDTSNKTVKIGIPWSKNSEWVKSWTEAYKSLYGGTVEYTTVSGRGDYYSDLAKMKASGKALDGAVASVSQCPGAVRQGLVKNADDYIDFNHPLWQTVGSIQKALVYKGHNYLVVGEYSMAGAIAYNKKLIASVGLPEPVDLYFQGKWNWDMFLYYAQQLTMDTKGQGVNNVWGVSTQWWEQFALSCGSDIISATDSGYSVNLSSKNFTRLAAFLTKLGPTQSNVALTTSWSEEQKMLREQKLGMLVTGNSAIYFEDMYDEGTIGVVPIPKDPGADKYYHPFGATGLYILEGGSNPKAAAEYAAAWRISADPNLVDRLAPTANRYKDKSATYKEAMKKNQEILEHVAANLTPVMLLGEVVEGTSFHYWDILNPVIFQAASWSSLVKKYTPVIESVTKKLP